MPSPSPDLWGSINTVVRANHVPGNVMPGAIEIHLFAANGMPAGTLRVPLFPPEATASSGGTLTPSQERILQALAEGPATATKLRLAEPGLYRRGAGINELLADGLVEKVDGKWQLTDFGWDYCTEHGLAERAE